MRHLLHERTERGFNFLVSALRKAFADGGSGRLIASNNAVVNYVEGRLKNKAKWASHCRHLSVLLMEEMRRTSPLDGIHTDVRNVFKSHVSPDPQSCLYMLMFGVTFPRYCKYRHQQWKKEFSALRSERVFPRISGWLLELRLLFDSEYMRALTVKSSESQLTDANLTDSCESWDMFHIPCAHRIALALRQEDPIPIMDEEWNQVELWFKWVQT
mmetsp:Transcript_33412/g.93773  ORF Transcript_33412/g.93773 Transcript_33412/m.93773 type:complete len:214 (+) Transcript_33412:893-1534(+)